MSKNDWSLVESSLLYKYASSYHTFTRKKTGWLSIALVLVHSPVVDVVAVAVGPYFGFQGKDI